MNEKINMVFPKTGSRNGCQDEAPAVGRGGPHLHSRNMSCDDAIRDIKM